MTERGRRHIHRAAHSFVIGPSRLDWTGQTLNLVLDERASPLPRRVHGRVRLHPQGLCTFSTNLDAAGRHRWGPIAPCARVEVELDEPALRWSGTAYFDSNEGDEPVERAFRRWDWLRAPQPGGACGVWYDTQPALGAPRAIGARFAPDGSVEPLPFQARQRLPATRWWRVDRRAPTEGPAAVVHETLEDTPFYARSVLRLQMGGTPTEAMHETLDVHRLTSPIVQRLLPFRMPRTG
jgi:carotenoid 1,2-hydratase